MPDQESEDLLAIAQDLAARMPLDWAELESRASDLSTRAAIRQLKIVASISDLYHDLPASSDSTVQPAAQNAATGDAVPEPHQFAGTRNAWGTLVLIEKLGQGSYGDVYRAWDERLDREVALKLLRGDGTDLVGSTVVEEGRLLARVRHPNVVTVYGADRIEGRVGVWMEFVRGRTLEDRLRDNGVLNPRDVVRIGIVLCRALAAVHDAGLLHRDIKAENVMIEEGGNHDGRLVLMDFGAGREQYEGGLGGEVAGTPLYLAPEIFAGSRGTPASDIYAVGVLLYHLLTGSYPVVGRTLREIRDRHLRGESIRLTTSRGDVSTALGDVIDRALAIDPGRRFQSAADFGHALSTIDASPEPSVEALPDRVKIARSLAWVGAALGVVITAFIASVSWPSTPRPESAPASPPAVVLIGRFENLTGERSLDGAVEYAIERVVGSSGDVRIAGGDRVAEVLRLMKRPVATVLDRSVAREVCVRDGHIDVLLIGRVEKFGNSYTITTELVGPDDNSVSAVVAENASNEKEVSAALRRDAERVVALVRERSGALPRAEHHIEPAATASLQAFQLYNSSYDLGRRGDWSAALEIARQMVEADPDFAAGWVWLAWAVNNTSEVGQFASASDDPRLHAVREQYRPYLDRARQLSNSSPEWERDWIEGSYYTLIGDDATSVPFYQALLKLRPDHYYAANNLSRAARLLNRVDLMLSASQLIADQRPGDFGANAEAATRTLEQNRDPESARRFIDRMHSALAALGHQALPHWSTYFDFLPAYHAWQLGEIRQSLGIVDTTATTWGRKDVQDVGTALELIFWYVTLGRASDAMRVATRTDLATPQGRPLSRLRALVFDMLDQRDQLRDALKDDPFEPAPMYIRAGLFDDARRRIGQRLQDPLNRGWNEIAEGDFALIAQNPNEAIPHLEAGLRILQYLDNREYDRGCESLATSLTAIGRADDALATLDHCMRNRGRSAGPMQTYRADGMHSMLHLADEYRRAGRPQDAIPLEQRLRQLLAVADADFPLAVRLNHR